jgi:hypothetical protein
MRCWSADRGYVMATVRSGGCLCGAVRYESVGEPLFSLLCHCRDCQHQSGSAYVAAMRVPAAGFRITKGAPKLFVSASDAGNAVTRAFCQECGCPLFIRVSVRPDIVGLRVGSLDDPSEFRPEADIFVKSAQPWDFMNPEIPQPGAPTRPQTEHGRVRTRSPSTSLPRGGAWVRALRVRRTVPASDSAAAVAEVAFAAAASTAP